MKKNLSRSSIGLAKFVVKHGGTFQNWCDSKKSTWSMFNRVKPGERSPNGRHPVGTFHHLPDPPGSKCSWTAILFVSVWCHACIHTFKMVDTHSEIPYIRSDWWARLALVTANPLGPRNIPQTNSNTGTRAHLSNHNTHTRIFAKIYMHSPFLVQRMFHKHAQKRTPVSG